MYVDMFVYVYMYWLTWVTCKLLTRVCYIYELSNDDYVILHRQGRYIHKNFTYASVLRVQC